MALDPTPISSMSDADKFARFSYTFEGCVFHPDRKCVLTMPPNQLLQTEIGNYCAEELVQGVSDRSYPFFRVISQFRRELADIPIVFAPLTLYVQKDIIRVELVAADCPCHHIFTVKQEDFYDVIRDAKIHAMDIQVEPDAQNLFEFIAFTLPGVWCRELKTLNVVFHGKLFMEAFTTLVKKSRGVSRLRVSHNSGEVITVSSFIKNMGVLEELELNCPDRTGSGYILDKAALKFIVEQEKRTGAQKPFRLLRAFNTTLGCTGKEFMDECVELSKLEHNREYRDYDTINEVCGRGKVDVEVKGNAISFEVCPKMAATHADAIFGEILGHCKSYLLNFHSKDPIYRYFMVDDALFRLLDYN